MLCILTALAVVYGDIGTSFLYSVKAFMEGQIIIRELLVQGFSTFFWTLMTVVSLKYAVLSPMYAYIDRHGVEEGGIVALYRHHKTRFGWVAMLLGLGLLCADGILTPSISVKSAMEGVTPVLDYFSVAKENQNSYTIILTITIIGGLLFAQLLGIAKLAKIMGVLMLAWFVYLMIHGANNLIHHNGWNILLEGIRRPDYFLSFVFSKSGALKLGAIFLCATGAEALFADLGHVGSKWMRIGWVIVLIAAALNYAGQFAFLSQFMGQDFSKIKINGEEIQNLFYASEPIGWRAISLTLATFAVIIASQALISALFTVFKNLIMDSLFPKVAVAYPTDEKGQPVVLFVIILLFVLCSATVLYFQTSTAMEAAYGLGITICLVLDTMLMLSIVIFVKSSAINFSLPKRIVLFIVHIFVGIIEFKFLVSNLHKIGHGAEFALGIAFIFIGYFVLTWYFRSIFKRKYIKYGDNDISTYIQQITNTSHKTKLVLMTKSSNRIPTYIKNFLAKTLTKGGQYGEVILCNIKTIEGEYGTKFVESIEGGVKKVSIEVGENTALNGKFDEYFASDYTEVKEFKSVFCPKTISTMHPLMRVSTYMYSIFVNNLDQSILRANGVVSSPSLNIKIEKVEI